jgi:hypothetical protein
MRRLAAVVVLLVGCGPGEIAGDDGTGDPADAGPGIEPMRPDARVAPDGAMPDRDPNHPGMIIDVSTFPFLDSRDGLAEPPGVLDVYSCAPNTDESGPEVLYKVTVPEAGFLTVAVHGDPGVDVDAHILSEADPETCLSRGDLHAKVDVEAGEYWVVVDTFAGGGGPSPGPFRVTIGFTVPSRGPCGMEVGVMERVNDGGNSLPMPATGPIVMEAHLVTQEEPMPYPSTETEELAEHYALSQGRTGFVMHRTNVWAPLEGGSFYGAGIGSPSLFPVMHEHWYVNMYWRSTSRPERGTRMILRDPAGGPRAVVVAAGYETGPGNLEHIGGTPEETHFYMGTRHRSVLKLGIATDQTLPYGPRTCAD